MKKLLAVSLLSILGTTHAAPFLSADPTSEAVTSYGCSFDGGAEQISAPITVGNQKQLHVDVSGLAPGSHSVTCVAKNATSSSPVSASFSFTRPALGLMAPTNLFLSAQ